MRPQRLLVAWLLSALLLGCGLQHNPEIPDELLGVWTTDAPGFEGRFMEFEKFGLTIGMGEGRSSDHVTLDVQAEPLTGAILYTISFLELAEGETDRLLFFYYPGRDTIQLKNRHNVLWTRRD